MLKKKPLGNAAWRICVGVEQQVPAFPLYFWIAISLALLINVYYLYRMVTTLKALKRWAASEGYDFVRFVGKTDDEPWRWRTGWKLEMEVSVDSKHKVIPVHYSWMTGHVRPLLPR